MAYLIIPFLPFIRMNVNSCGSVLAMESAYITEKKLKSIKRRKIFPTAFYTMIYIILPVTGTDTFLL